MEILFTVTGDIRRNSRALKQLQVFAEEGYRVLAVGLGDVEGEEMLFDGVRLQVLRRPSGGGPRFFRKCHQLFKSFAAQQPAQVYHASDLYNLPAMVYAAKCHNGKVAYDARERYPYVASTAGRPLVRLFWSALERRYIRKADAVFTVSLSIASHLVASYNIELPPVLHNVPVYKEPVQSNILREELDVEEDVVLVLHQGNIQKDRGCLNLARAMQHVSKAVLVFLGDGALKQRVAAEVTALGIGDRVKFKSSVPPAMLHTYTCSADIGVTMLEDTCLNHQFALPNKLFEYLMAGLPVLASDLPESGGLVEDYEVGCVANAGDPDAIARALQQMVDSTDQRTQWSAAIPAVFETFNWEKASQRLRRTYKNLISTPRS